jgi:dihydropteroate synthase
MANLQRPPVADLPLQTSLPVTPDFSLRLRAWCRDAARAETRIARAWKSSEIWSRRFAAYNKHVMSFAPRSSFEWKLRTRSLMLGENTRVMGIVNLTPDSFSDSGRFWPPAAGIEGALAMLEEGAAIVDLGGESTRPGKRPPVSAAEEQDRVLPVLEGILRHRPDAIVSIDTYKAAVAEAALERGAEIVNDVSGLTWDPAMAQTCAAARCGLVIMHTRGRPEEWRRLPRLGSEELVALVKQELERQLGKSLAAGLERAHVVLDPGLGFGKAFESNYPLLARLGEFLSLGQPVLAGPSRKSFLGRTLAPLYGGEDVPLGARENASLAAATAAILAGASLVRAHEVRPTVEAAAIADAVLRAAE